MGSEKVINKRNIFIEYTCIRNIPYLLLKFLKETTELHEVLKDYINFEPIVNVPDSLLYKISMSRKHYNIIKCIPLLNKDIDCEASYKDLIKNNLYDILQSDDGEYGLNSMAYSVNALCQMEFFDSMYVYYEDEIYDIVMDMINLYGETDKIKFVSGNFKDLIFNMGNCDMFIFDDYSKIQFMKDHGMVYGKEFLLSDYVFNLSDYKDSLTPKVLLDEDKDVCKFGIYSPININVTHINKRAR